MKNLLKLFLILSLSVYGSKIYSQSGLQFSYIKPSQTFGFYFKANPALEFFNTLSGEKDKLRYGYSVGLYYLKARLDTFHSLGVLYNYGYSLVPAYEIIKYYFVIPVGFNTEYRINSKKLYPLIGIDGYAYFSIFYYQTHTEGVVSEDEIMKTITIALVPKIGAAYDLKNDWRLSLGIGRSFGLEVDNFSFQQYWKPYLSVSHVF